MFRKFLVPLLLIVTTVAHSQQDLNSLGASLFDGEEFLPVREAFKPSIEFIDDGLVVHWDLAPAYYLYKERFGASIASGEIEDLEFEPGIEKIDEFFGRKTEVYYDATKVKIPSIFGQGQLEIIAQGCADAGLCYAPTSFWFDIDTETQFAASIDQPTPEQSSSTLGRDPSVLTKITSSATPGLLLIMAMAFTGGIILNLMPCVFPVLAIKALKITTAGESATLRARDSLAYTAGILVTTLSIAGIMLTLRAGGAQLGWGFQLQSPIIVIALMYLFFIIGLSLSGWLLVGARFTGIGQDLLQEGKPFQSFFTGVLAMVVASQCTAPFMAVSLGYAVGQPTPIALLVFVFLGLGMAFPLVLLNSIPSLARRLPKPGPWMEKLKELLAFPMYFTSIWLLWVLTAQIGATGAALAAAGLCTLTAVFWTFKQTPTLVARAFAVALLITTGSLIWQGVINQSPKVADSVVEQNNFSIASLDAMIGGEKPVFVDVTADWCITCKFNESRVLNTEDMQAMFAQQGVIYVIADWTNENPDISVLLERYNRVGIPLYLYFPAGSRTADILPQILTKDIVREHLFDERKQIGFTDF